MDEGTKFREILHLMQKNVECAICLELLKNPVSTKCDHQFCKFCIIKFIGKQRYVPCPLCKEHISRRSLQERPELGNVVNKVKDLIDAFNSDASKDEEKDVSSRGIINRAQEPVVTILNAAPMTSKAPSLPRENNSTPVKRPLDYSEDYSELDLAEEGDLQKYLSKSLVESATRRSRGRLYKLKTDTNCVVENQRPIEFSNISDFNSPEVKENLVTENEYKKNKDKEDLLRYIEEGSCGAVCDDDSKSHKTNLYKASKIESQGVDTNCNEDKQNELDADSFYKDSNMKNNCVTRKEQPGTRVGAPLSPTKLNTVSRDMSSKIYPVNVEAVEGKYDSEQFVTPAYLKNLFSTDIDAPITPESDTASISSTQQLMKPIPVVSRTYSKIMKTTFQADGLKYWKKTLPSPHAGATSNDELQLKGLTTKEKIALKKKKKDPITALKDTSTHSSNLDQSDVYNANPADLTFDVSGEPRQKQRRKIFKSRSKTSQNELEKGLLKVCDGDEVQDKGMEDPYEFHGSQTPQKSVKEISKHGRCSRKGLRSTQKSTLPQSLESELIETHWPNSVAMRSKENEVSPKKTIGECCSKSEKYENSWKTKDCKDDSNVNINGDNSKDEKGKDNQTSSHPEHIEVKNQKTKKVCFADEWSKNKMEHNDGSHSDLLMKPCLQERNTLSLKSELSEIDNLLPEEKINENGDLPTADRSFKKSRKDICGEAQCVKKDVEVQSKDPHEHMQPNDDMYREKADKRGINKQNKLLKIFQSKAEGSEQNISNCKSDPSGNIFENVQNTMEVPKQKRGKKRKQGDENKANHIAVGKRTLSRRQRNVSCIEDSEAELAKMAHKIIEAEDHDFAFCTQEAHIKMQEEQEKQNLYREAFGFDTLVQGHTESLLMQQNGSNCTDHQVLKDSGCNQNFKGSQGASNLKENEKANNCVKDFDTTSPRNIKRQMASLEKRKEKEDCGTQETRINLKSNQIKNRGAEQILVGTDFDHNLRQCQESSNVTEDDKADMYAKDLVTPKPEIIKQQINSLKNGTEKENSLTHDKCHTLKAKEVMSFQSSEITAASCNDSLKTASFNTRSSNRSRNSSHKEVLSGSKITNVTKSLATQLPRPNVYLMVQFFPSTSHLGSTPKEIPSTADVVLETPSVAEPVSNSFQFKSRVVYNDENSASKMSRAQTPSNVNVLYTHLTYKSGCKKTVSQNGLSCKNENSEKIPLRVVETKELDEAITFTKNTNEPEEGACPATNGVKPIKAFCSKLTECDKPEKHNDCLQKLRTDEPYHDDAAYEDEQEVDHVNRERDKDVNYSSCKPSSCDAESEDADQRDVLAVDTMCFDCDETAEDVDNDAKASVPDSLQVLGCDIREDQLDKQTEFDIIEETQGTEETCIPVGATHELTKEADVKILDSKLHVDKNPANGLSEKIIKGETVGQISCLVANSASSQPMSMAAKGETTEKAGDICSNSPLLSQSIFQTNKSPNNTSKSNNTNIVSSSSTEIILPTAQETKFTVSQNLDSESQKSDSILCKGDTKASKKLIKDINPVQGQLSDDDDDEDDCEDCDEDEVLMIHRPKRKCFSLEAETIKPLVYQTSDSCTKREVHLEKNVEGDAEMLGETQALDVLETESQDVENASLQGPYFKGNHTENISISCEQIETVVETERVSVKVAPNSAEDNIGPFGKLAPRQVEKCVKEHGNSISPNACQKQVTSSTCHENSKHLTNPRVLPHLTAGVIGKDQNTQSVPLDAIKSVKTDQSMEVSKDIRTENPKSSYSIGVNDNTSDPGQCDKPKKFTSTEISIVSVESARTSRTRRGLAAKLTNNDEAQSLMLSVGAQEAIRRSVEMTKSKLVALSNADKIMSEPVSEVIDLDVETEQIMYEKIDNGRKSKHANQSSKQATSPDNVSEEFSSNSEHPQAKSASKKRLHTEPLNCGVTTSKLSTFLLHSQDRTDGLQLNNTTDQVMSDLKACFGSSNDDSSEDENWNRVKYISSSHNALHNSVKKRKTSAEDGLNLNCPTRSCLSPIASSPANGVAATSQPDPPERSVITGIEESPVDSDDDHNEEDEDGDLGATVRGKKRLRQQITSDSDEPDEEEQSQSKSSVSSVLSSQAEILSTQQAQALEGDVDKLRKEIAIYEAKLGAQPVLDFGDAVSSDDNEEEDECEAVKDTDSAALCKRLPDVFVVDESPVTASERVNATEEEKSEDDLFVSPLSPSPPSRQSKVKFSAPKRPRLAEPASQVSENFLKQFHSPGGTIRSKKQLEFVQSSLNSFVSCSGSATQTKSPRKEEMGEVPRHRPSSPVLSSQRTKLFQGKNIREVGPENMEKLNRKICFVTSGLTRRDNTLALALAKDMGLVFSPTFTKDVTHVVMRTESDQSLVCDRTLKFFQGIAHKCWVVAFSWMEKSLSLNRLLPEAGFEITGDTSAGEFAGGVSRSGQSDQPLFADFCFACVGTSQEMPKESLSELLTVCGASCVEDPVALISQVAKHKIIVRCSDSDTEPSGAELDMFNGLYKHMSLVTVIREWILDSLGSYALQPMASYVLNTVDNVVVPF